ncbi:DUF3823 domain-containing protein [Pedobacter sp. MR22-3]|uniref:DUF3823 domain-containing protein n=1 Tax=Pedobacter sp. MR22-3 TaxID=2994552 RepID=UPI0022467CCC|nr:DUF3823 domain-containing protein [Pedobacter sp. MR22-3]MCX2585726.1 DUF3823 domain-containing protein [Pedobacter sp. MR22-3]
MKKISYIVLFCLMAFFSCKKDNYDAPTSRLTGRILYQNQTVGVRSDGVQLELWQHGYSLFTKIPVFVAQDGTFSATLFDGDYKLVRLRGNGPWLDNPDSIAVKVSGNTQVDVPVVPHFTFGNVSFNKSGNTVSATFTVQQVTPTSVLERVNLYLGTTMIVDNTRQDASAEKLAADIVIGQSGTITVNIPAALASRNFMYARLAVKTNGVGEALFSAPQRIEFK